MYPSKIIKFQVWLSILKVLNRKQYKKGHHPKWYSCARVSSQFFSISVSSVCFFEHKISGRNSCTVLKLQLMWTDVQKFIIKTTGWSANLFLIHSNLIDLDILRYSTFFYISSKLILHAWFAIFPDTILMLDDGILCYISTWSSSW